MVTFNPPVVPVFPAGYGPLVTDFNTWWYQTASFLQNRVVFRATQASGATTLPDSGARTTIAFDTIAEDPYSGWNATTHAWTPPAGYSGWYQVTLTIRTATLANNVDLRPFVTPSNNTATDIAVSTIMGSSANGAGADGTWTVYLVGGEDSVTGQASLLNSGSNVNTSTTAGQQSFMGITWLSQT